MDTDDQAAHVNLSTEYQCVNRIRVIRIQFKRQHCFVKMVSVDLDINVISEVIP